MFPCFLDVRLCFFKLLYCLLRQVRLKSTHLLNLTMKIDVCVHEVEVMLQEFWNNLIVLQVLTLATKILRLSIVLFCFLLFLILNSWFFYATVCILHNGACKQAACSSSLFNHLCMWIHKCSNQSKKQVCTTLEWICSWLSK